MPHWSAAGDRDRRRQKRSDPINIGFIGVGHIAQYHLKNLATMRGVRITAVCDVLPDRADQTGRTYGAQPYVDYRTMLKKESLDACYVCVMPSAHGRIELDLARARLPFFVEKPVHLELTACRRVIEEVHRADLITCVGYHWRYSKASRLVKTYVERRRPSTFEGWWYSALPAVAWWRRMELSGGQLVEQTTHIVDMARFLVGEVHSVFATATTGAMKDVKGFNIHDASLLTLRFDNGAIGQITSGCLGDTPGRVDVTARGRRWEAWTDSCSARFCDHRGQREVDGGQQWHELFGYGDRAFVGAIRSHQPSKILSPYPSGAQSLAISLSANRSIKTGRPVTVPRLV